MEIKKIRMKRIFEILAPRVGFEPTTLRLTAGCSAVELPRNEPWRFPSRSRASEDYTGTQPLRKTEFA